MNFKGSGVPYFPIVLAIGIILGVFMGARIGDGNSDRGLMSLVNRKFNKLSEVVNYIEHEYVDSVDRATIEDEAIQHILQELDPHSIYITADEVQAMNEPLEGKFDGIGIEFSIKNDTIVVISPIVGGPSEKLGIRAGDRIILVDGENVAGIGINNRMVMDRLRGESGSKVKVSIKRGKQPKLLEFNITRDKIPIYSVDFSYVIHDSIGYVKISRFARNTYEEFVDALSSMQIQSLKGLVLDLRGNGGGYLDAATRIADELLPEGKLIVYTEGRNRPRREYVATSRGKAESIPLVVLIDEGSASASEIVSGAVQDNDRGLIIGRRSFGKGLVQEQSDWPDGSAMRLTIARYYTPAGRCIQKPYDDGTDAYQHEYLDRMTTGELLSEDNISFADSLKYTTATGRIVFGGGGIMPDEFVPYDTTYNTDYLSQLVYSGTLNDFAFKYVDKRRTLLKESYTPSSFVYNFSIEPHQWDSLILAAKHQDIPFSPTEFKRSKPQIELRIKASIARYLWHNQGYYPVLHLEDDALNSALKLMPHSTTIGVQ